MIKIPLEKLKLQEQGVHLLVNIQVFDRNFKMVLDTGASKTVFDKQTMEAIPEVSDLLESSSTLSSGLGTNSMESFMLKVPQLHMEAWSCKNMQFAVLDLNSINYAYEQMGLAPVVGVLGGDILDIYAAKIDYKTLTLQLRKTKRKV